MCKVRLRLVASACIHKALVGAGSTLVPDKPEPFRFSVSPSRGASPNQSQGTSSIETPRKTLSRNPNGVYRWQGAGSSRPRNRYQSPGFAPRPQQHRIKLSPPKTPLTTDTKRRRVGDEAESSTPQKPAVPSTSTISFPSSVPESPIPPPQHATHPSGTFLNGKTTVSSTLGPAQPVTPKANVSQPRLRTAGLVMKPTTPAIPSPLRQTWKESDSPPHASPPSRPTRAADFMSELIKEVTPTKKPDVSNPYQTASPVKPPAPVRKPVTKRSKPTAKSAEKPREQVPEISAQAVIEATVPKVGCLSIEPKLVGSCLFCIHRVPNVRDRHRKWKSQVVAKKSLTANLLLLRSTAPHIQFARLSMFWRQSLSWRMKRAPRSGAKPHLLAHCLRSKKSTMLVLPKQLYVQRKLSSLPTTMPTSMTSQLHHRR